MSSETTLSTIMQMRMMIMSMPQKDAQEVMIIARALQALISSNHKAGDIALTLVMLEHDSQREKG